jgi:acetyl esterase/lipase
MTFATTNASARVSRLGYNLRHNALIASIKTRIRSIASNSKLPAGNTVAHYEIDADMQSMLDAQAALGLQSIEKLEAADARKQPTPADAVRAVLEKQGPDAASLQLLSGVKSYDDSIPGCTGSLPVRIYMPPGTGPFPVVVYFHGGGWVLADKNVYDNSARGIAKHADAIVISVDYRLAPEAKFPAQHDDAFAAYL